MINYEIRVSLQDNRPEECKDDGKPYCAIVMAYDKHQGVWYNPGIAVMWSSTPDKAFKLALNEYKRITCQHDWRYIDQSYKLPDIQECRKCGFRPKD